MDSTGTPMSMTGMPRLATYFAWCRRAQVEAAQLTDLPCNVVGVHHAGDIAHQLGRSVVCSALAAAAGVLEQRDAAAC